MKKYSQIKKEIEGLEHHDRIATEIALCVLASTCRNVPDKTFDALCSFVYICWSDGECGYIQLIADVVVDCFMNCDYGYREQAGKLTLKQLEEADYKDRERILEAVYDKYQDGLF